jgi:hypothetical protein
MLVNLILFRCYLFFIIVVVVVVVVLFFIAITHVGIDTRLELDGLLFNYSSLLRSLYIITIEGYDIILWTVLIYKT